MTTDMPEIAPALNKKVPQGSHEAGQRIASLCRTIAIPDLTRIKTAMR